MPIDVYRTTLDKRHRLYLGQPVFKMLKELGISDLYVTGAGEARDALELYSCAGFENWVHWLHTRPETNEDIEAISRYVSANTCKITLTSPVITIPLWQRKKLNCRELTLLRFYDDTCAEDFLALLISTERYNNEKEFLLGEIPSRLKSKWRGERPFITKSQPYIHMLWLLDANGQLAEPYGVIRSKRRFRKAMIEHYFVSNGRPVAFQLLGSPNTDIYRVIPYINRNGDPSVCYSIIPREPPTTAFPPLIF